MGQNKEELLETKRYAGAYTLKELRDGKWNEENDFGSPRAAITEACTDFEQCQKERDHFKAAYERKLVEHAETLSQAQRVCEERDEWRQKALDVAERLAAAEETLKRESEQARAARTMLAKGWPAAKSWLDSNMEMERAQFADRLAAAEGHAQKLREALETIDGALPYFHPKFVQDQAARARKIAAAALAATPAVPLKLAFISRGEWAGAHRVMREFDNEAESFEAQGNHAAARRLRDRLEEVKKELK